MVVEEEEEEKERESSALSRDARTDGRTDDEGKAAEVADPSDARAPDAGGRADAQYRK